MEDKNYKIYLLEYKANKIFNHIIKRIESNNKYIFSEACTYNLKLYFKYIEEKNKIIKNK